MSSFHYFCKNLISLTLAIVYCSLLAYSPQLKASSNHIIEQDNEQIIFETAVKPQVDSANGVLIISDDQQTIVVHGDDANQLIVYAAKELVKYLSLSTRKTINIKQASKLNTTDNKANLILLGNADNNPAIARLSIEIPMEKLGNDGIYIQGVQKKGNQVGNRVIIAGANKGVLNGVYEFLNRTVSAEWFPPRTHINYLHKIKSKKVQRKGFYRVRDENRMQIETSIRQTSAVTWADSELIMVPETNELGMLYDKHQLRKSVVDWSVKNKLNTIVAYIGVNLPLKPDESNRIKEVVSYAHQFGVKVYFFTFLHVAPKPSWIQYPDIYTQSLDANTGWGSYYVENPITLQESTKLMVSLVNEYDLDGIGWHPATETIKKIETKPSETEEKRPKYFWDTLYINEYYKAIKHEKPRAKIFAVLGWHYMNPPSELAKVLPKDITAWIVPSRKSTQEHINEYRSEFENIWFWMYPYYSSEGVMPAYAVDRLQKHTKQAKQLSISGIVPELYGFRNHEMNAMALTKLYWNADLNQTELISKFLSRFYNDNPSVKAGFKFYSEKNYKAAFDSYQDAYLSENNALIKDRLKDVAIGSLFMLDLNKDKHNPKEIIKLITKAQIKFNAHYNSNKETDLFDMVLTQLLLDWTQLSIEKPNSN